jgi:hypothetical protein
LKIYRGGEKMKMKKWIILVSTLCLLVVFSASPVMAIGPWGALENGNNPNLAVRGGGGLSNFRGGASGSQVWAVSTSDGRSVEWKFRDPSDAKGLMNNAYIAHLPLSTLGQFGGADDTIYENKWIYLSGDGGTNADQYAFPTLPGSALGSHGLLWWFFFFAFGANPSSKTMADAMASAYPNGALFMYNNIYNNNQLP